MANLPLLLSPDHDCGYLPEQQARSLLVSPTHPMSSAVYSQLIRHGFRRSGNQVYRPHCRACSACIPVRIPVNRYQPNRAQRRNVIANADLTATPTRAAFQLEHYVLYQRYLSWRHPDGNMADTGPEEYLEFLGSDWCDTEFIEFRAQERLAAVAVVDCVADGLSAVYTFYEPDLAKRGLGDYAVQWQIRHAQYLGLEYLYLGYWIAECRKMAYKNRYRPFEVYRQERWIEAAAE